MLSLSSLICLVIVNHLYLACTGVLQSALSSLSVLPASIPLSSRLGREEECLLALANQICKKSYWLLLNQWVQQGKHGEAAELKSHTPSLLGPDFTRKAGLCCHGSSLLRSAAQQQGHIAICGLSTV